MRFFLFLLFIAGSVHATSMVKPADYAFERFMQQTTGVGAQSFSLGPNGLPVPTTVPPSMTMDGGRVKVDVPGTFKNPAGADFGINGTSRIPPANIGVAVGKFFVKVLPWVTVGAAAYDMAKELGFLPTANPDGSIKWQKSDPSICTVGPCYEYQLASGSWSSVWSKTQQLACESYANVRSASDPTYNLTNPLFSPSDSKCTFKLYYKSGTYFAATALGPVTSRSVAPSSSPYVDSTQDEFLAMVNGREIWTSESRIADLLNDMGKAGIKTDAGPLTITGPATSLGAVSAKINSDNTTSTSTTTYNHTYQGNVVTTTSTTVTNVTNTTTGAPISTETKTDSAPVPPTEACGLPGKAACKIDETGTPDPVDDTAYKSKLDKTKSDQDALREQVGGNADKSFFTNWQQFFVTPPLATCRAYSLPHDMGSVDPCPVVDGVRSFMAFLWAVTALWAGIKMVREVV